MLRKNLMRTSLGLLLIAGVCSSKAQNYSIAGASVNRVITNTTSGSGGYTYGAGAAGGTVTANSSVGSNQNASTTITIEFAVAVVNNVAPATPQGTTDSANDVTTCTTSQTNGSASANAGYTYSPVVSVHSGTSSNYSYGPWNDFTGATTLLITATASTSAFAYNPGSASAYADSVVSLVVH